jgi:MinD superfamily P-loop ATPase
MVCVNKFDLNPSLDKQVREYCARSQIAVTESIPFDDSVPRAIGQGLPLVEFDHGPASHAVAVVWQQVRECLAGTLDGSGDRVR